MNLNEYQKAALATAVYPEVGEGSHLSLAYCGLGVAGEGGEVAEKVKKHIRNLSPMSPEFRDKIIKELGDVLWYVAMMAFEVDATLDFVAATNVYKLADRAERGVLNQGEGDNR